MAYLVFMSGAESLTDPWIIPPSAGYYSWRNTMAGSWFVQALCGVLRLYGTKHELMWLMTRVNHCVAYQFKSSSGDPALDNKKQIPAIVSHLTKQLYFTPKVCKAMDINSS